MRQIDNYTDKEREVLAIKGMTAPRTASERANLDAPIPPDRLPWKVGQDKPDGFAYIISANGQIQGEVFTLPNAKLIVRAVNHADKLAEALRAVKAMISQPVCFTDGSVTPRLEILLGDCEAARNLITETLAAYEAAQ